MSFQLWHFHNAHYRRVMLSTAHRELRSPQVLPGLQVLSYRQLRRSIKAVSLSKAEARRSDDPFVARVRVSLWRSFAYDADGTSKRVGVRAGDASTVRTLLSPMLAKRGMVIHDIHLVALDALDVDHQDGWRELFEVSIVVS